MIKDNQHMFPNKILVKIDNLCERPDCRTLKRHLKIKLECPSTRIEFFWIDFD
jgi:hypothetical protein